MKDGLLFSILSNTLSCLAVVEDLKEADQDFEFYPTTNEIISVLIKDIKMMDFGGFRHWCNDPASYVSLLDIGAGNGKVLRAIRDSGIEYVKFQAIEKSTILLKQLDPEFMIVGTDFEEQSLFSKGADLTFCNPPYKRYEQWSEKIIRQSSSRLIYLVVPVRWEESIPIKDALKFRDAKIKKVGSFDFENSEDRKARAKVDLLRIELSKDKDDAFDRFFNEQFKEVIQKFSEKADVPDSKDDPTLGGRHRPFHSLVVGPNYPEDLVNIYNSEMSHIQKNYMALGELDIDLMREFEIFPHLISVRLKNRLTNLRHDYWHELFSHLATITDRLTAKSRQKLLETLHKHAHVDFTVLNIYGVVIWVINNANGYIDNQLIECYELMVDKCNAVLYKSNQRTWANDGWRYNSQNKEESKNTHFALDYRIVTHRVGGVSDSKYSFEQGLKESAALFMQDLMTIANNLGFKCDTSDSRLVNRDELRDWKSGTSHQFNFLDKDGKSRVLFEIRAFKNGNLHLKLNQKFILALNVEYGRLRGWLRSASEAVEELKTPEAADFFKSNLQLGYSTQLLLA